MVDAAVVGTRFLLFLLLGGLIGATGFARWAGIAISRRGVIALAIASIAVSAVGLVLLTAQFTGEPAWPIDWRAAGTLLAQTAVGTAWLVRIAALLVVAALPGRAASGPAAAVAVMTLAWGGHGAMDDGAVGWTHLGADILHLLAAAFWAGALMLLTARAVRGADGLAAALHRFSAIGVALVAVLVASGLVNGWLLVGPEQLGNLAESLYGQLLLAKLALFAVMLGLAALNRYRLTAALEAGAGLRALRISLAAETANAITILALVAWLGTLAPPASG